MRRIIQALSVLEKEFVITLNKKLTVLISDSKKLKNVEEIEGIKRVAEANYLVLNIVLSKG